jgi:ribose 5-phosphate isomerase B
LSTPQLTALERPNIVVMKVVLGSDERNELTDEVARDLRTRGHEVELVGPPGGQDIQWAEVGRAVGEAVATGRVGTGVLFCWTGTGASIAANKVAGARAALCTDKGTAEGARKWNDANVLVMSLRLTTPTVAGEMLDAWFETEPDPSETDNVARLEPTE